MHTLIQPKYLKATGLALTLSLAGFNANASEGADIFNQNCSVCHAGGGNTLNPAKNLTMESLQANGYADLASVSELVASGKAPMPPFKSRLSEAQIKAVSEYVLEQAKAGW